MITNAMKKQEVTIYETVKEGNKKMDKRIKEEIKISEEKMMSK